MSAGGLARLGVRCADASTGMATIGVFCGELAELDQRIGGGKGKKGRRQELPRYGNRAAAMREDEEIMLMVEAYYNRHRKH